MTTARDLIHQHPTNNVLETGYTTTTDKAWARRYEPLSNLQIHSSVGDDGYYRSDFESAFLPLADDDTARLNEPCVVPNVRKWRLETEADCENWFHTEIANVVLAAWAEHPVLIQTSHTKPLTSALVNENVDDTYSVRIGNQRTAVAIGEFKRNLMDTERWQSGRIGTQGRQDKLSRELRGYAHKYGCPRVFCFDGATLLLLQFRASKPDDIGDKNCPVDCWVIPRSASVCTLRYGLYQLLAQGWKRCQGLAAPAVTAGGISSESREFFTGRPIWRGEQGRQFTHPLGYSRYTNAATGALMWAHEESGDVAFETQPFW